MLKKAFLLIIANNCIQKPLILTKCCTGMPPSGAPTRLRMSQEEANGFDAEVSALVADYFPNGIVTLQLKALVIWGKPVNLAC